MSVLAAGTRPDGGARSPALLPPLTAAGFLVAVAAVVVMAVLTYGSLSQRSDTANRVSRTLSVLEQLQALMSGLKDAETGQRGFLLTGAEPYLAPYDAARAAVPSAFERLRALSSDSPVQLDRLATIERLSTEKFAELAETIGLQRTGQASAALAIVRSNRGRATMDRIRELVADMAREEQAQLVRRQDEWQAAGVLSNRIQGVGSLLLIVLIGVAAVLASRDHRAREIQTWLRTGQAGLAAAVQGERRLEVLGERLLRYLADYLDAPVGALYVAELPTGLRRVAAFAAPAGSESVQPGDGLLGQVARDNAPRLVRDLPPGYLPVGSSLGAGAPRELLLAPASVDGEVLAVIELGFLRRVSAPDLELMERVAQVLGIAVRAARDRSRLEELLEETQHQSEELQTQQEELRVSNEELEEQGRALKESQAQLESQQSELEQSNAQLETHARALRGQRDELARSETTLAAKAAELERANQYKSEFLANMSHELRTPLNSTLILANLLADNKGGNLTHEQVKFAQTIASAGNDLLVLINDILDLSRIEAGMVEVRIEPAGVAATVEGLVKGLLPIATEKGLALRAEIDPAAPTRLDTDVQRLGQILKNLLANALKFTHAGEVVLRVAGDTDEVRFAVHDTGIGIDPAQHALIFDAFRQADGSTHRQYGGTGLGLSISRDLAHLLGGRIEVVSAPGQGSVFTLILPRTYGGAGRAAPAHANPAAPVPAAPASARPPAVPPAAATPPAPPVPAARRIEDDRDNLRPDARLILVIEDDLRFAGILRDLAHELDFQCVMAHSAAEGLQAAVTYSPKAILLDMNLPDQSGLSVLDHLKRDARTRHMPVHVLSVADYVQEALARGAIGYDLKPVKRVQLVQALERLEAKFSQRVRRVLVVEDDERQRDSMGHLLAHAEVEIVGVPTAAAALEALRGGSFDCMILDLNLPDLSGYELLRRMADDASSAFPPVIVYTGRSLGRDEEQQLRRFSRSIIIKDARSPERLLDEVTLFLHQVESNLPAEAQRLLRLARDRDQTLDGKRILVVEDDVRNVFALSSVLEPKGAQVEIARNGREALTALARSRDGGPRIDLVLMDIMMPEMDGYAAMREIRKQPSWQKLPIIALTAKAMRDDQEKCLAAGASDYMAKPLDAEKLLSLVRVWMPQ